MKNLYCKNDLFLLILVKYQTNIKVKQDMKHKNRLMHIRTLFNDKCVITIQ